MKATIYKGMDKVKETSKDLRSPGASHSEAPSLATAKRPRRS